MKDSISAHGIECERGADDGKRRVRIVVKGPNVVETTVDVGARYARRFAKDILKQAAWCEVYVKPSGFRAAWEVFGGLVAMPMAAVLMIWGLGLLAWSVWHAL